MLEIMYDVPSRDDVTKVIVTEDCIQKKEMPLVVSSEKKKKKKEGA
jgi:ATP-dependent Clp protease ATP-binding subunit ClpX